MKKTTLFFLFSVLVFSCKNEKGMPDVSGINVEIKFERFDREFFSIDSNNIQPDISQLSNKYPELAAIFIQNILGLDSISAPQGVRRFLGMSGQLNDTINIVFKNTSTLESDFKKAFQFVKYYFPAYKIPAIITIAGPVDAMAQSDNGPSPNFLRPDFLGISLQFYLGKNFSVYSDPFFVSNVAPTYRCSESFPGR
jgi:hypothetical protein